MERHAPRIITWVMLAVMAFIGATTGAKVLGKLGELTAPGAKVEHSSELDATDSLVQRALELRVGESSVAFRGSDENPFRPVGRSDAPRQVSVGPTYVREPLILKGVLIKGKPLAILADKTGQTFIRGAGEKIGDQMVVTIEREQVTLRDALGTYQASVSEP